MKTTPNRSIDRRTPLVLGALAASTLTGCGFDRTIAERTTLGADQAVWTLTPALVASTNDSPATATASLTRSNWQPVDFIVPVDGTIHGPLWRWDAYPPRETARQKALYPTAETALELASPLGPQVREAVVAPLLAFANSLALPVLVFTDPPADFMSPSAATLYKRSPKGRPTAGPIPEPAPPASVPPASDP
jgi:hypothetical protein